MKTLKVTVTLVSILMVLWLLFSWVDTLSHNDPFDGDFNYSPVNMFVLLGKLYG